MDGPDKSFPAVVHRAREAREDASARRGASREARRHAPEIPAETNAILDTVADMTARVLRRRGFALRAPVAASFRIAPSGSTGVEIIVRLEDPSHAAAAKAALLDRFPDPLADVIVN